LNHKTESTKDALRREALRLFAERGFRAVSIRDIADAVGIRQGGVYNHFDSKQGLLVDVMTLHMETLLEALKDALIDIDGPAARLDAFVRFHIRYHIDYPDDVMLAYMELRSLEADGLKTIMPLRDRYEAVLCSILEEGAAKGLFQIADTAVHTRAILAMLTGVTVWYREGGGLDRQAIIRCYVQIAMQSVGMAYPSGDPR